MRGNYCTKYKLGDVLKTYIYDGTLVKGTVKEITISTYMTKYQIITDSNAEYLLNEDEVTGLIE